MYNIILVRYGEIYLKTKYVRKQFERILIDNINRGLKENEIKFGIRSIFGRIIIETKQIEKSSKLLQHTFGVVSFSPTAICEKRYDEISKISKKISKTFQKNTTFAVEAKRSDKSFLLDSQGIKQKIGSEICKMGFKVNLSKPKNKICIEVRDKCYIYDKVIPGPGGLPVGTAGRVASSLKSKEDLVAAWLMMKRGADVIVIGRPNKELLRILETWIVGRKSKTAKNMNEAKRKGSIAVVSSRKFKYNMVVFNPLIGYSKDEIKELYKTISR